MLTLQLQYRYLHNATNNRKPLPSIKHFGWKCWARSSQNCPLRRKAQRGIGRARRAGARVGVWHRREAKLKKEIQRYSETHTAIDRVRQRYAVEFAAQVDAAANLIKQVGYLKTPRQRALQDAQVALEVLESYGS